MGRVVTLITGDARQFTEAQKQVAREAKEMAAQFKSVDQEVKELDRASRRWLRTIATDQDKYNAKMAELSKLLDKGKLSMDQYQTAVNKVNDEYEQASRGFLEAFGEKSLSTLGSWAIGLTSIGSIVSGLTRMVTDFRQETEEIANVLNDRFFSRGQLMQVSVDTRDFQNLLDMSDRLLSAGAAADAQTADRLVFALRSTGQEQFADMFSRLAQSGLVENLEGLINATDSLKDAFGTAETGTPEQLASKALAVGAFSQRDLQTIAAAAAAAGASAAKIGLSDEETLAVVGALADPLKTAETAATRLRALSTAAQRQGVKGGSLFELLDNIEAAARKKNETILDFLGQQEATEIFDLLRQDQNAENVRKAIELAQQANDNTALRSKVDALLADPTQAAVAARRAAEGSQLVAEEMTGRGAIGSLQAAIEAGRLQIEELQGMGRFGQGFASLGRWGASWFTDTPGALSVNEEAELRAQARAEGDAALLEAVNRMVEAQVQLLNIQRQVKDGNDRMPRQVAIPTPEN